MRNQFLAMSCIALLLVLSSCTKPIQLGRITAEVNFREGPSRSSQIIGRLRAGAEVEVISRIPSGWYFVRHGGRLGFVHESYVKLQQPNPKAAKPFDSISRQFGLRAGIILVSIGLMLMVYVLAPFLLKSATAIVVSLVTVVVLDLGFQLGALYSFFSVVLGLLILAVLLTRKPKNRSRGDGEYDRRAA